MQIEQDRRILQENNIIGNAPNERRRVDKHEQFQSQNHELYKDKKFKSEFQVKNDDRNCVKFDLT